MKRVIYEVRRLLLDHEELRDNDKLLTIKYIQKFVPELELTINEDELWRIANFEDIARASRRIKEKDKSLRGSLVRQQFRKIREEAIRKEMSQ